MTKKITYSIQQVSNMTGLSKQVIRKWEDRYGIISPERLENGYRIYRQEEVEILQKVIALTKDGQSVKQAAILLKQNSEEATKEEAEPKTKQFLDSLVEAGRIANDRDIFHLLEQAHYLFGLEPFLKEIVTPFLERINQLLRKKEWGAHQEAICSQTVRDFFITMRHRFHVADSSPLVLGSCLPNERHEIPLYIQLIQSMVRNYRTLMLGASPASNTIESTVRLTNPRIVLLSGTTDAVWKDNGAEIRMLDAFAHSMPDIHFFISGDCLKYRPRSLKLNHIKEIHSIEEVFSSLSS